MVLPRAQIRVAEVIWMAAAYNAVKSVPAWVYAALVALIIICASGYGLYRAGAASERAKALQHSVDVLRERKSTDEEIHNLSDADLCRKLGGVPNDNGECL
jgi:hypothetical protein